MVSKDFEAKILRYFHVEQWHVGTIARQLRVHHSVVERVLSQAGFSPQRRLRGSIVDPYVPFILETLKCYPRLSASRLFAMVKTRGYPGAPSHFRAQVALRRPRPTPEAYLRLSTLKGEQAQVDWGHFGQVQIGKAHRPLMAFVMVLSWSRQIFVRFYLNQQMENFLRGHVAAFEDWQGVPRVLLYDNLKSAVLERQGDAIRFNPILLELAAHYRFEPRPVAVARGNEKGRVERAIRYIRENFFAGRTWSDIDDLNAQAQDWCWGCSAERLCPEDRSQTVRAAFAEEQGSLLALPDNPFVTEERVTVTCGKTPYVRFDRNDYSVPHTHVQRSLTVLASLEQVRILDGIEVIASHPRCFDKGQQIENPDHIAELTEEKHQARQHRGQNRLTKAVPITRILLEQAALRGSRLGGVVSSLLRMLDAYGAMELEAAVNEALKQSTPHPHVVARVLEQRRQQRALPPPMAVALPEKAQSVQVRTPHLQPYDQLTSTDSEEGAS